MHPDLRKRRAVLIHAWALYEQADADWRERVRDAARLVPDARGPSHLSIGDPGSPVRVLYEKRERALQRITVAKVKLETARERLRMREAAKSAARLRFIVHHPV